MFSQMCSGINMNVMIGHSSLGVELHDYWSNSDSMISCCQRLQKKIFNDHFY